MKQLFLLSTLLSRILAQGYSYDFGLANQPAHVNNVNGAFDEWTVEMFVNPHATDNSIYFSDFLENGNLFSYLDYASDRFIYSIQGNTLQALYPVLSNTWHHIAAEYDGDSAWVYVDGITVGRANFQDNIVLPSIFNVDFLNSADVFGDNYRFSSRARYQGENFNPYAELYSPDSHTELLYYCNEGTGNILTDDSENGYPATVSNSNAWSSDEPQFGLTEGVISGTISLNEDYDFGQVRMELLLPGGGSILQNWGENPPFTNKDFSFMSTQIVSGGPYAIEAYFDANDNNIFEDTEPYVWIDQLYVPVNLILSGIYLELVTGGTNTGSISGNIHLSRAFSGMMNIGIYYPGSDPENEPPDGGLTPVHVNLAANDVYHYSFIDLADGNGYYIACFLDADGSANSGTDSCDYEADLHGLSSAINISGASNEIADINTEECPGVFEDFPVLSDFTITNEPIFVNSEMEFSVLISSVTGIDEAKVFYYFGGNSGNVYSATMDSVVDSTNLWVGSIPANYVTVEGLVLKVYARSNNGDESETDWWGFNIRFSDILIAAIAKETYQMISVPGVLDDKNITSLIEGNLGAYDPTQWRVFRWQNSTESYIENNGSLNPGSAFWLISRTGADLYAGSGVTTSLEDNVTVSLETGWNMIANPYNFELDFPEQTTITGDIDSTIWSYDGTGYGEKNKFSPGSGYWLYAYEDSEIEFNHLVPGSSPKLIPFNWSMDLSAQINGFADANNRLGVHPAAKNERDGLDSREPPVIGDYIQLGFDNTDWQDKGLYGKDIRKDGQTKYTWNLTARTNMVGEIEISAMNINNVPLEYEAILIDLGNKVQHDILTGESYKYVSIGDEQPRQFQLFVGSPEEVRKSVQDLGIFPMEFSVDQNTPNPFNPVTSIRFQLAQDAAVSLKIYNILGEEVRTLTSNEPFTKGYHQIIYNGKDANGNHLPSGLYFYRTEIRNAQSELLHSQTNKMIIVK